MSFGFGFGFNFIFYNTSWISIGKNILIVESLKLGEIGVNTWSKNAYKLASLFSPLNLLEKSKLSYSCYGLYALNRLKSWVKIQIVIIYLFNSLVAIYTL